MVVNAAIGNTGIKINPGGSGFAYSRATSLGFSANAAFGAYLGSNTVTVVNTADTTQTLFKRTIDVQPISTLYISGQSPAIDTTYRVEQNLPFIAPYVVNADNSAYIRFVNLSPNSGPLNINIKSATTNEVTALPYRGISAFKKYDALTTTPTYVFEIRDATTNQVLFTSSSQFSISTIRYKTMSVIIKGLVPPYPPGTPTANQFGILQVNYF